MKTFIGKTPFFRLLIPVVSGIIISNIFPNWRFQPFILSFIGWMLMLLSYAIDNKYQYRYRWVFGVGVFLFIFSLAVNQYRVKERESEFQFDLGSQYYTGIILDIPEVKARSIAINVKISHSTQPKVILYLEADEAAKSIKPGDEIIFYAKLQPFRNMGNPDDFDYVRYMKIKGFAATAYIESSAWLKTGRQSNDLATWSQRSREKALDIYRSLIKDNDACAFIAALTLGYKEDLSRDIKEAFRASGTSHVLAVSGLHVGIIYLIINLMFSFLGNSSWRNVIKQGLIILTLWMYVSLVGGSASVVRASIMLSIFCMGKMLHQKGFTYNTLAAAAFFILLFRPFSLFDVGFQMSFTAVASILYFQPGLQKLYRPNHKIGKYVWDLLTVSTAAQLGVFPLVLHYFGTFPTWFFITNLLVVPLVGLIIYSAVALMAVGLLNETIDGLIDRAAAILQWISEALASSTLAVVQISESLPFAQLTNNYITPIQLLLLLMFIFIFARYIYSHRERTFITALSLLLIFQLVTLGIKLQQPAPQLTIFNQSNRSEIALFAEGNRHFLVIPDNGIIAHPQKRILRLSDNDITRFTAETPFSIDVLVLSKHPDYNVEQLISLFSPSIIVLDSSIPRRTAQRIRNESNKRGIDIHDVVQDGAFSLNF